MCFNIEFIFLKIGANVGFGCVHFYYSDVGILSVSIISQFSEKFYGKVFSNLIWFDSEWLLFLCHKIMVIIVDILSLLRMALFDLRRIVSNLKRNDKLWLGSEPYMLDLSLLVLLFGSLLVTIQEFIHLDVETKVLSWSSLLGLMATVMKSLYSFYLVVTISHKHLLK